MLNSLVVKSILNKKIESGGGSDEEARKEISIHTGDTNNPHSVTKSQVGLGNVDNTADADKSVKHAASADSATKATQDGNGKVIIDTYATKEDLETETQSVESQVTVNLLKPTLETTEKNGVTCTNNGDGTYTINGTATTEIQFKLIVPSSDIVKSNKTYKLCGCPSDKNASSSTFELRVTDNLTKEWADYGNGVTFSYEDVSNFCVIILVRSGKTVDNVLVKPMLTTNLSATYDDFVKYTGDTGSLNSDVAEVVSRVEDTEAEIQDVEKQVTVNLLKPTLETTTKNGVTCTNNGDGTYTIDTGGSSATAQTQFDIVVGNVPNIYDGLKLLGCPPNGATKTFNICVAYYNSDDVINGNSYDTGSGAILSGGTDKEKVHITILIRSGATLDNAVFKPMLTTNLNATYDDFVPFTGTTGKLNGDVAELEKSNEGKMDKENPTGTGAFSMNRKADTTVGKNSTTEGGYCEASGSYAHAEGYSTTASGSCSHAGGYNTIAGYDYQTAIGEYNENKEDDIFEVGNGTKSSSRSNALELTKTGDLTLGGDCTFTDADGNKISMRDILTRLAALEA